MRGFGFCNFPCTSMLSLALLWSLPLQAEMVTLNESEMSEIDGAGIGLVLDNFTFSHGTDAPDANGNQARIFRITGIKARTAGRGYHRELTCTSRALIPPMVRI